MKRLIFLVTASLAVIAGLAVVHFSLVNAQPGSSPLATGHPTNTPIPPTITPTPTTPSASLSIEIPLEGPVGTVVRVVGFNFSPSESVSITFGGQPVGLGNNDDFFVTHFAVPDVEAGTYEVLVGETVSIAFIVTPIIHACSANHKTDAEKQGQLRIVSDPAKCHQNETPIFWNQK